MKRVMIGLVLMSVMVVGGLVGAKPFDLATAVTTGQATIADVAWLAGRWTGTAGSDSTDETCTAPARGVMTCMFPLNGWGKDYGVGIYYSAGNSFWN